MSWLARPLGMPEFWVRYQDQEFGSQERILGQALHESAHNGFSQSMHPRTFHIKNPSYDKLASLSIFDLDVSRLSQKQTFKIKQNKLLYFFK